VCHRLLELGLRRLSRSDPSDVAELACIALQEYPAWADEFPRRGFVHNILTAALAARGESSKLRRPLILAVKVVKLVAVRRWALPRATASGPAI
jgi:hypothetical protein